MSLPRSFFDRPVLEVAPALLGCTVHHAGVVLRLTEVEAYAGADDAASHSFRGRTPRNAVMFGPAGHAYVYFTYGMHWCLNLVCQGEGEPAAVLLRAGEVVDGLDVARARRPGARDRDLARGPARLTRALAIDRTLDGADVCTGEGLWVDAPTPAAPAGGEVRSGPRVGVRDEAERPWRFWLDGEPTVSAYRPAAPRRRRSTS